MPFGPEYFEKLEHIVRGYLSKFPCGNISLRLRAYGSEYLVYRLLYKDDSVVCFLYHDEKKMVELPSRAEEPKALPAMSVPYECIESVEFDPSKPDEKKPTLGFVIDEYEMAAPEGSRDIEEIWERIVAHEGETFRMIRGGDFQYEVRSGHVVPDRTKQHIPKLHFSQALGLVPLADTTSIQYLRGPSFICAILMDERIRQRDW